MKEELIKNQTIRNDKERVDIVRQMIILQKNLIQECKRDIWKKKEEKSRKKISMVEMQNQGNSKGKEKDIKKVCKDRKTKKLTDIYSDTKTK